MADAHAPQFGVPQGFKADRHRVATVRDQLATAGVSSCMATFVDIYGVPKAKVTPIEVFEHMCDGSELYTVGACEGMGLAGPHEDECARVPESPHAIGAPWDKSKVGL